MKRMVLSKLTLSGPDKKNACLVFKEGLNVISGDSDTGKTYAFQCIDYLLGKEKPPKEISESQGYSLLTLEFKIDNEDYTIQRTIGENKVTLLHNASTYILSCKHDSKHNKNLSKYLLNILLESDGNIIIRKDSDNNVRTLSFRDMMHLCLIDETKIIAEESAFQSAQYTEKTVRSSIFKYIITKEDDSKLPMQKDVIYEISLKKGVVQFLEQKKIDLQNKISTIENDEQFNLYLNNPVLNDTIEAISTKRREITNIQNLISDNAKMCDELNKNCAIDESKITEFKMLEAHYGQESNQIELLSSYEHFINQLPQVACPFCKQPIKQDFISKDDSAILFSYWQKSQCNLYEKRIELISLIKDIEQRLNDNLSKLSVLQQQQETLNLKLRNQVDELNNLSQCIADIQKFDTMKNTLSLLREELLSLESSIEEYSQTDKEEKKSTYLQDNSKYNEYCNIVSQILEKWDLCTTPQVEFNSNNLDLVINGKPRTSFGKGYRAFIMSAMTIGLMRYCQKYDCLHPGFVIIDSPLVSLKERKKDSTDKWIDLYMEKKMINDILLQDSKQQVIIFENKDLKFDNNYNYIEFNHDGNTPNGFIPK